jgi:hypothetical protein
MARSMMPETGAGQLQTGDLVLIDLELAEHQRWAGAQGRVGEVASLHRAEFIAEAVGSGFVGGVASGTAMGLGMGLVSRFVPVVGPILGAGLALHSLSTNQEETAATVARFGEGNDTYDKIANSIATASAIIDTVSQMLTVANAILGVVEAAAVVVAGGAIVAAFFTFGATVGIAVVAGELAVACQEVSTAIGEVTLVLDKLNAGILQPCVTLFRALHTFTTEADPREVEAQGQKISQAAGVSGAALGAWAGGALAHTGAKPKPEPEDLPPAQKPVHETPPPATDDGPTVHFQEPATPAANAEAGPVPDAVPAAASDVPAASTQMPATTEPALSAGSASATSTEAAAPPAVVPEQLSLPHTEGPGSELRPISAPLELQGIKGSDAIPKALEPGSIGTYGRGVDDPHPAALLSNPAGAPGATAGGGRMPSTGREEAGVYLEHQTSAAVAHEVLPGHELHGPEGQRRGGRDTKEALVIALPESVKSTKDNADTALRTEVRNRVAQGEQVPAIEVISRSAQITQDAVAQSGAEVPGQQISRNFLAEVDQFHDQRFGYQEIRPGEPLTPGHPLASGSSGELDAFMNRTFDPFITAPEPGGGTPPASPPAPAPAPAPATNQMSFDFGVEAAKPPAPTATAAPADSPTATPVIPPVSPTPATLQQPSVPTPGGSGPKQDPASPTAGTRARQLGALFAPQLFAGDGEGPTYAQRQAAHRARFTADNQPGVGVERVNPNYPPPPATPAQIEAVQNEILNLLRVRAAAEQEAQLQAERANQCEANQAPIEQTVADAGAGLAAVRAHDEAVARRAAVNQEQQQRQQESQGLVAGYPGEAAGLTVLTAPLAAWAGFTSLAAHLPGSAGESMLKMNDDANRLLLAFGQMAGLVDGAEGAGPANEQRLQDDKSRLQGTAKSAERSDERLQTAQAGAQGLQQANEAALAEASERKATADERAGQCGDAASVREARAASLAQQLRVWAARHAQARQQAIAATSQRLQREGRIVVHDSEK